MSDRKYSYPIFLDRDMFYRLRELKDRVEVAIKRRVSWSDFFNACLDVIKDAVEEFIRKKSGRRG